VQGDGKFDQSNLPSDVDIEIGRVDLSSLPAFSSNETELTRAYLNKARAWKRRHFVAPARAAIEDNLQWVNNYLAETGWRTFGPTVGANNIRQMPYYQTSPSWASVMSQGWLWSYASGGGYYGSADGIATTDAFAAASHNGIFNMMLGSYFGDWDNSDNLLRAPLASGRALTSVWAGLPSWFLHTMAAGETIGHATRMSQNNRQSSALYMPQNGGWQGQGLTTVHLALHGDPTLRQAYVEMPSNLVASATSTQVQLAWQRADDDAIAGYHIYRIPSDGGAHVRLTTSPVTGTSTNLPIGGQVSGSSGARYMVRAVRLEVGASGSYTNLSLGALAQIP
jgi:hypothetical protein